MTLIIGWAFMGISYSNVLLLHDVWTMHDLEPCLMCPNEITEGEPSISIIDSDDFLNDILTGGDTKHSCNLMVLQHLEHRIVHEYGTTRQTTKMSM